MWSCQEEIENRRCGVASQSDIVRHGTLNSSVRQPDADLFLLCLGEAAATHPSGSLFLRQQHEEIFVAPRSEDIDAAISKFDAGQYTHIASAENSSGQTDMLPLDFTSVRRSTWRRQAEE